MKSEVPAIVDRVGCPESIRDKEVPPNFEFSALLSMKKSWLIKLRDSSKVIETDLTEGILHTIGKSLPKTCSLIPSVGSAHKLAEILLRQSNQYDLVEDILAVNKDILGHYSYKWNGLRRFSGHVRDEARFKMSTKVIIYWGVIGLVAMALGVSVEDLTVVVLSHEIAHAYTHLGFDIDQYRWGTINFSESAHEVKEGLAQYYTDRAVKSLEDRVPGAKVAFDALLEKQPDAYQEHLPWVEHSTPEAVRNAFILLRKTGPISRERFGETLFQITADYRQ